MLSEQEVAQIFASSTYLKVIMLFRLISSGIAIICMAILEINRKKFVAHDSLKLLLSFHGFWTFVLCISTFTESARQTYAHFTFRNASDLLVNSNQCMLRMTPQFFGTCGSVTSLLAMSAERYEASQKISTYERTPRLNGLKFIVFHSLLTLIWVFMDACMYGFPSRVAHCTVISVSGLSVQSVLASFMTISEIFTAIFYHKSLRQNKLMQASEVSLNMSLTERYQLSENIRVLRLLLPIVISHFSITMVSAFGFFCYELVGLPNEFYPFYEETMNLIYLQGIFMPLIFLNQQRKKRLTEVQLFNTNMATGEELITVYEGVIRRGW